MRSFFKIMRPLLTLGVAVVIVGSLWNRLAPQMEELPVSATTPKPFDAAFIRLTPREIVTLPWAVRFDQPLGSPNAALTYNARPFRIERHLGDDLNGIGGENSDLGDSVFAAGNGRVVYAGVPGPGWGKMVILAHRVPDLENLGSLKVVQTVYAHLDEIRVLPNQSVHRGEEIGTVGTAGGQYLAHLHFEVRDGTFINPSVGYADVPLNRLHPHTFITQHRGAHFDQLNPPPLQNEMEVEIEAAVK